MQIYSIDNISKYTDAHHPTTKYALEIVNGFRVAGEYEILSCKRHLKDIMRQGTDEFPYIFDETRANRIFDWFFKCCKHVKGIYSGQPIELLPFQKYDLGSIFGWVHKDTGVRRFKYSYNKVARGHAKSTVQSGVANYVMCGDCYYPPGHPELKKYDTNPQVECCAYDKGQAKIVWEDAKTMGEASPDIRKRLDIKKGSIKHKTRGGYIRPLSKDTKNKDGLSPNIAIIDEYHAWKNSEIYDVVTSAFGKRAQNLVNIITTAGKDSENNPCKKEEDLCKKILKGEIKDETYFAIIRELDKDDNPHDKKNWLKANPMLQENNDYTKTLRETIETEYNKAYGSGDHAKIREFLTKRCNLWQSDSEDKFMDGHMDKYKALGVSRKEFLDLVKGARCYVGLDLSKTIDLTAAAYVFPLADGRIAITAHGFIPSEGVTRHENSDQIPYRQYAEEGWCTITPGEVTDYHYLIDHIHDSEFDNDWDIKEICYDPYSAEYCTQDLEREGYTRVMIRQGVQTLSEPTKFFREAVLKGKLVHDGSPLLTWCVSNAIEVSDNNGNIKLSKKHKDDTQRIDLLAAAINAIVRAQLNFPTEEVKPKVWKF